MSDTIHHDVIGQAEGIFRNSKIWSWAELILIFFE